MLNARRRSRFAAATSGARALAGDRGWCGRADRASPRRGGGDFGGLQILRDDAAKLLLDHLRRMPGVYRDELLALRHGVELLDQGALVGEEAVEQVVAVVH